MTSLVRPRGLTFRMRTSASGGLAVGDDLDVEPAGDLGGQLTGAGVVGGDDQGAAGADAADEGLEGLVDLVHRGVVGVVVQLDVEDDGDLGGVLVEAAVALVGLGDEDLALAVLGVGAGGVQVAADGVRRLETERAEGDGEHGGGGRLAVGAGDGDRAQAVHQGREGVGAVHDRDAALVGGGQLGVVRADRGGDDDAGGVLGEVVGRVADVDRHAEGAQGVGRRGVLGVAARHLRAALREDLRDARHAGSADADEVRPVHRGWDGGCHGRVSLIVASGGAADDSRTRHRQRCVPPAWAGRALSAGSGPGPWRRRPRRCGSRRPAWRRCGRGGT